MIYKPQLETFLKVADAGSFSKAADESYITPTAIIKQINILEADLGIALFVRTHQGITLTDSGKSMYKDTKYLIKYAKDSVERAKSAMLDNNIISIGTSPMTPSGFLIKLWPKIHEKCPDIKFKLTTFENTPENAREILRNFGQHIDVVAGWFDKEFLKTSECEALELFKDPIRCAVPITHKLAQKDTLTVQDMYGENLMLNYQIWNSRLDRLRNELTQYHTNINIVDFEFYDVNIFNKCANSNSILMTFDAWKNVHPMLKIMPVDWEYTVPFGLLHSPSPSKTVYQFLNAVLTHCRFGCKDYPEMIKF